LQNNINFINFTKNYKMLTKHLTNKIIFLNVETVPQYAKFEDLPSATKAVFLKKFGQEILLKETLTGAEDVFQEKAGLTSEFGKIACISFLVLVNDSEYH